VFLSEAVTGEHLKNRAINPKKPIDANALCKK
jgi:hypothetical protein